MAKILSKVERRYKVKLPRGVLAVDYGERNDLYIRFKRHVEKPVGEPTEDGLLIFFYDDHDDGTAGVEILDLNRLMQE